jgi:O-antigen/teichoic acid export membrane protein
VTSLGTIVLVVVTKSPIWVGVMLWFGQFAADLFAFVVLRRRAGLHWERPSRGGMAKVAKEGAPLMASVALFQYALVLDLVVLGLLSTPAELGIYSATAWLVVAAYVFVQVPLQAAYPELVRRFHESSERYAQLMNTLVSIASRATLAGAALVIVEAPEIVHLLFGEQYAASADVFPIQILVVPLGWYAALVAYVPTVAGHFGRFLLALIPPAIFATIALPILISEWGMIGAAVGAALTMSVQALAFTLTARRYLGFGPLVAALKELPYGVVPVLALLALELVWPGAPLFVTVPVWALSLVLIEAVRGFPSLHLSGLAALKKSRGGVTSEAAGQ